MKHENWTTQDSIRRKLALKLIKEWLEEIDNLPHRNFELVETDKND